MKRILSMILMSALLLGTLTACGGQTTSEGDPSSAPSASEETRQESTTAPSDSESVSPDESETTEPSSEATEKKLKMTVNGQAVLITLYDLTDLDHDAQDMFDLLMKQYAEIEGVTEHLKVTNQMEWVRRINNIRNRVTEIVCKELIYI